MNASTVKLNRVAVATVLLGWLLAGLTACATAAASPAIHHDSKPEDVVTLQFALVNTGMASGDFSTLAQVFAPDATLTKSSPSGVTTVYQGLPAITAYYQGLRGSFPQYRWTTDSMRTLSESVVLAYEHAGSPPLSVAGRCVHVIVVHAGKIVSYDWAVFYPGKP